MAKKNFNKKGGNNKYRKEYREMSGRDKTIPGQYRLDIGKSSPPKGGKPDIVEEQPRICSPYYSRKYYETWRDFLNFSGSFSQTYYLYESIKNDPDIGGLEDKLAHEKLSDSERKKYSEQLETARHHLDVMQNKQHCNTLEDLRKKGENEREKFFAKLSHLLEVMEKANVPMVGELDEKRRLMILMHFYRLDHKSRLRRDYYRQKFINKALKALGDEKKNPTAYYPPLSFYEMETKFRADKEWQERQLNKKKKT